MKTVFLFILIVFLFSCEPEPIDTTPNVVFYTTGQACFIEGEFGYKRIAVNMENRYPECNSLEREGFFITYLPEGEHPISIITNDDGTFYKTVTVGSGCNLFDVSKLW